MDINYTNFHPVLITYIITVSVYICVYKNLEYGIKKQNSIVDHSKCMHLHQGRQNIWALPSHRFSLFLLFLLLAKIIENKLHIFVMEEFSGICS